MKERYTTPQAEIIEFDSEDLILTSSTDGVMPDDGKDWSPLMPVN